MTKRRKLLIVGDSAFAEIAFEYFTHDSDYEVVAFSVERPYLKRATLFNLPVVPFDELTERYDPNEHSFYAAVTYTQMNALRKRLYEESKRMGYTPASYVSSHAFVWRNCQLGEHCFVFENNVLQPFVKVEANVVFWSGNHIGHHSTLGSHSFISSHVVISGFVRLGESCFMGVNSTVSNNVTIGDNCLIGAGALVLGDVPPDQRVVGTWKKPKNAE